MIISLSKITLLNLLLLNSSDAGLNNVPAFTPNKLSSRKTTSSSSLSAAIDPADPYANVLEAYQKKKAIVPDSLTIDIPSIPDTTLVDTTTSSTSSTDSMVQAVNEAVNTAIDASNTATEAAAAISTASATAVKASLAKVATATAASTATATTLEPGKAPTLLQYLTNPSSSTNNVVPSDSKEKLAILKSNLGMTDVNMAVPSVSLPKVAAVGTAASTSDSININNVDLSSMLEALHLDEYGAWYITALTAIYALNQKQAGKMEAKLEFESELLEAKTMAEEAANAALIAAQGAKQAKELVMAMEVNGGEKKKNVGEVMLENSKIGELTVLNELMSKEMERLKQENESQKNTIASLTKSTTPSSTSTPKSTPVKLEIPIGKSTMPRDPQEEEKILNILKDIDADNAKLQAVASKQKKKARASKTKKATPKASVKKTSKKKKAAKKKKAVPVPEPFFAEEAAEIVAEVEKEVKAVVEKPVVKKKKKTTPKKRGAAKKPESDDPNPWGSLKESTLKRKTIAQLTAYLNERKVDVEGLSKAELVGTIQKL